MRKLNRQLEKVRIQIQEDRMRESIEALEKICKNFRFPEFNKEVIALKARLSDYEKQDIYGTLSSDDVTINKIRKSCLSLIDAIEVAGKENLGVEEELFIEARRGVRETYIERSKNKVAGRDMIDLEVSYTVEGSHDLAPLLNKGVEEGQKEQDLFKVFEGALGRLLIIGLPGSGKTTLLLQLAILILDKYEEQIPVVLDVATWQPRFKTIEEWAVELLPDMGFNKRLAQQLISEKKLLPLFDGLDELGEGSRPGFLSAVEQYGTNSANKFVITSRKAEYAATIDAAVEYQVVVNPFTLVQIRETLQEKYSPERVAILDCIDKDEHFAEAIKTPFYLNAVQLLFSHKNLSQKLIFKADNLEGRQREIETAFVEHTLGGFEDYSKENARRWLAFLADRMGRRGLVRFELVDMQYDWGRFGKAGVFWGAFLTRLIRGLVAFLLLGLVGPLILGLAGPLILGLTLSLTLNVVLGLTVIITLILLVGSLYLGLREGLCSIDVRDNGQWSTNRFLSRLRENSPIFLGNVMFLGLGMVLLVVLGVDFEEIFFDNIFLIIFFGILVFWLIDSLLDILNFDFNTYLKTNKPYQRFHSSLWYLYFSILQHWHLCYLLRKKGLVPIKYPDFLKAVTKQNILESDSGSWRFRHRILQEYFAGVWDKKYGDDPALADNWKTDE